VLAAEVKLAQSVIIFWQPQQLAVLGDESIPLLHQCVSALLNEPAFRLS
jgi:hypothetical protein